MQVTLLLRLLLRLLHVIDNASARGLPSTGSDFEMAPCRQEEAPCGQEEMVPELPSVEDHSGCS